MSVEDLWQKLSGALRDEVLGFLDDLVAKYAQASQVNLQLPAGSVFAQHGLKELRPATVAPTGTAFDDVMGVIVAGVPGGIVRLWRWRVAPGGPETLALVVHESGKPVLALAPVLAGGQPRLHVVASDREAGRVEVGRLSVAWRADGVVDRVVPGGPATEAGRVHVQVGLAHTIDLDPVLGTGPLRGELWVDVRAGTGAGGFGWRAGATFGPLEVDLGRITGLPIPVAAGTGPLGVVATPRLEVYAGRFGLRADIEPVKVDLQFSPAGATGVLASLLLGWSWTLELSFSRFDGDTLTGRLTGRLSGVHSAL